MSEATNRIKKIIMALLAKAGGTDNEAEAAAFLAKAHEMLEQYQLDIGDLVDADDPIIHHTGLSQAESGHAWRWKLYSAVGKLYGCKSIHVDVGYLRNKDGSYQVNKAGKRILGYEQRLVGRESAIITTDLMYPWLVSQVRSAAKAIAKQTGMSEQGQAKRVAAALLLRIHRLIREQEANSPAAHRSETARNALMVIQNAVALRYEELYPPSGTTTMSSKVRTDNLSRDAANSIGLHRQAGGRSSLKLGHG